MASAEDERMALLWRVIVTGSAYTAECSEYDDLYRDAVARCEAER